MKKRYQVIVSALLIAAMLLLNTIGVCAGGITFDYELLEDNTVKITAVDVNGFSSSSMAIPSKIDGYPVTVIGSHVFSNDLGLRVVKIPATVKAIEADAFDENLNLTEIYYSGTKAEWEQISVGSGNDVLLNATVRYAGSNGLIGDIDQNGTVNMRDALTLYQAVAGKNTLTDAALWVGDVNGDGTINMRDALFLYKGTVSGAA